jgi:hypothetical protein
LTRSLLVLSMIRATRWANNCLTAGKFSAGKFASKG